MHTEQTRRFLRTHVDFAVRIQWTDAAGRRRQLACRARDLSRGGICLEAAEPLVPGCPVEVEAPKAGVIGEAYVRHVNSLDEGYRIGFEFHPDLQGSVQIPGAERIDYYEILQINPAADAETIHRVFRIMAARFHPDNPESGDTERFLRLREAYETLSNPESRARYDARYFRECGGPIPVFQMREFVDEVGGEMNRRLGVLCLLYSQRRKSPEKPGISVLELERMMSLPREYLGFTLWYLQESQYVRMTDCSDYSLTAAGVNYVEDSLPKNQIAQKLLTNRGSAAAQPPMWSMGEDGVAAPAVV